MGSSTRTEGPLKTAWIENDMGAPSWIEMWKKAERGPQEGEESTRSRVMSLSSSLI